MNRISWKLDRMFLSAVTVAAMCAVGLAWNAYPVEAQVKSEMRSTPRVNWTPEQWDPLVASREAVVWAKTVDTSYAETESADFPNPIDIELWGHPLTTNHRLVDPAWIRVLAIHWATVFIDEPPNVVAWGVTYTLNWPGVSAHHVLWWARYYASVFDDPGPF